MNLLLTYETLCLQCVPNLLHAVDAEMPENRSRRIMALPSLSGAVENSCILYRRKTREIRGILQRHHSFCILELATVPGFKPDLLLQL